VAEAVVYSDASPNVVESPLIADRTQKTRGIQRRLVGALLLTDTCAVGLGLILAYVMRFPLNPGLFYIPPTSSLGRYLPIATILVPLWILLFACYRLYDTDMLFSGTVEYGKILSACTMGIIAVIGLSFFWDTGHLNISRGWLLLTWMAVALCTGLERFIVRRAVYTLRARGQLQRRTLVVGTTPEAQMLAEQIVGRSSGMEIVGFVSTPNGAVAVAGDAVLGRLEMLRELIDTYRIDDVVLVPSALAHTEILAIVRSLALSPVTLRLSPGLYEVLTTGVQVADVNGVPLVTMNRLRIVGLDAFLKRSLDCVGGAIALIALSPLMLLCAVLVRIDSRGPILHRRMVVGQGGKRFEAFKFRTMVTDADRVLKADPILYERWKRDGKLPNDPRITRVGRFLRRTSIDELPQLFNVLRGEMSLVGPRMITVEELARFGNWRHNLLTVKPGMTGLWQVRGRSRLSYAERVTLDMHYIRNYTIWQDIRLLIQTVPAIVRGHGAY
jgi:exopolysaccharide biosynthesis polyprenyl glycosylphosphotransferase